MGLFWGSFYASHYFGVIGRGFLNQVRTLFGGDGVRGGLGLEVKAVSGWRDLGGFRSAGVWDLGCAPYCTFHASVLLRCMGLQLRVQRGDCPDTATWGVS